MLGSKTTKNYFFVQYVVVTMLFVLTNHITRKSGGGKSLLWVRAFSTTSSSTSVVTNSIKNHPLLQQQQQQQQRPKASKTFQFNSYSTSSTLLNAGAVEQDLDSALDELLSGSFEDPSEKKVVKNGKTKEVEAEAADGVHHMKDSHPVPIALIKEVSYIYFFYILVYSFFRSIGTNLYIFFLFFFSGRSY
jgi:hypothetical protein